MAKSLSEVLIDWFRKRGRHMPWRPDEDPYRIWLLVVMLQQTRVETVLPYYERFVSAFPTLADLAKANPDDVLRHWKGLGYYCRARNLHASAREMVARYDSQLPKDPAEMRKLPGVGKYTAAAVASIAWDWPLPAVDGNVLRFLSRLYAVEDDITEPGTIARLERLAQDLLPDSQRGLHNQAVMDFGALVCAPRPLCENCPVSGECLARKLGIELSLPVKTAKKPPVAESRIVVVIFNEQGAVLLHRRPTTGLLAGFWEFPNIAATEMPETSFSEQLGLDLTLQDPIGFFSHVFSHRRWDLQVHSATLTKLPSGMKRFTWCPDPGTATLPRAFSRILELPGFPSPGFAPDLTE